MQLWKQEDAIFIRLPRESQAQEYGELVLGELNEDSRAVFAKALCRQASVSCAFETLSSESPLQGQRSQDAQEAGGHRLPLVLPQLMAAWLILGFAPQCDLQVLLRTPCSIGRCLQRLHPFLSPLSGLSPEAEDILGKNDLKARVTTIQVVYLHSQTHIHIVAQQGIFIELAGVESHKIGLAQHKRKGLPVVLDSQSVECP